MPESRVNQKERELLRQAIEAKEQLRQIARTVSALETGVETVRADGAEVQIPLDKTRVAALSAALNARFRLLNKVLPDLKAVEMDLGEGALGAMREYTSIERAARLAFLLQSTGLSVSGRIAESGDASVDPATGPTERRPTFLS